MIPGHHMTNKTYIHSKALLDYFFYIDFPMDAMNLLKQAGMLLEISDENRSIQCAAFRVKSTAGTMTAMAAHV